MYTQLCVYMYVASHTYLSELLTHISRLRLLCSCPIILYRAISVLIDSWSCNHSKRSEPCLPTMTHRFEQRMGGPHISRWSTGEFIVNIIHWLSIHSTVGVVYNSKNWRECVRNRSIGQTAVCRERVKRTGLSIASRHPSCCHDVYFDVFRCSNVSPRPARPYRSHVNRTK